MSQIQILTSKITQVCQEIHDIKFRHLLVTRSDKEPTDITTNILTNQRDHKDIWGSDRKKPGILDIHEGHAEDGNNYAYSTPNHLKLDNQDNQQHHETYPPQLLSKPSEMPPAPLPYPDPSEASEMSSSLLSGRRDLTILLAL